MLDLRVLEQELLRLCERLGCLLSERTLLLEL